METAKSGKLYEKSTIAFKKPLTETGVQEFLHYIGENLENSVISYSVQSSTKHDTKLTNEKKKVKVELSDKTIDNRISGNITRGDARADFVSVLDPVKKAYLTLNFSVMPEHDYDSHSLDKRTIWSDTKELSELYKK